MKKIVLTLALAAFAFAANAQFVLGGQIAFNTNGGSNWSSYITGNTTTEYTMPRDVTTNFVFAPKFGYNLNDKMHVGVVLGFSNTVEKDYSNYQTFYRDHKDFEGWHKTTTNSFYLAPYFRYTAFSYNKLSCFVEAQLTYMHAPKNKFHTYNTAIAGVLDSRDETVEGNTTTSSLAVTIVPGVNYRFSNHFSADLYIDIIGLAFTSTTAHYKNTVAGTVTEWTNTIKDFGCIANLNAETLDDHLNLFRLGFNYHF